MMHGPEKADLAAAVRRASGVLAKNDLLDARMIASLRQL
jgi:hypothetical protein